MKLLCVCDEIEFCALTCADSFSSSVAKGIFLILILNTKRGLFYFFFFLIAMGILLLSSLLWEFKSDLYKSLNGMIIKNKKRGMQYHHRFLDSDSATTVCCYGFCWKEGREKSWSEHPKNRIPKKNGIELCGNQFPMCVYMHRFQLKAIYQYTGSKG